MNHIISIFFLLSAITFADITHENQIDEKNVKIWEATGVDTQGDYIALDGDHTGTASIHIRAYAEKESLYLWFIHISQNDLVVKPINKIYPKYVKTRTNGTWKAENKVEYLRFVSIKGVKGVMFGNTFYKKANQVANKT